MRKNNFSYIDQCRCLFIKSLLTFALLAGSDLAISSQMDGYYVDIEEFNVSSGATYWVKFNLIDHGLVVNSKMGCHHASGFGIKSDGTALSTALYNQMMFSWLSNRRIWLEWTNDANNNICAVTMMGLYIPSGISEPTDLDQDSMPDGWEIGSGLDPTVDDSWRDLDGDGLRNIQEFYWGTSANRLDTDNDDLSDDWEVSASFTDPLNPDSDGDGLTDGYEINTSHTNPLLVDTDGDGLTDNQEVNYGTAPLNHFDPPLVRVNDQGAGGVDWADFVTPGSSSVGKLWNADGSWNMVKNLSAIDFGSGGGSLCILDATGVGCVAGRYTSVMSVFNGVKLSMAGGVQDHVCVLTSLHTAQCAYMNAQPNPNTEDPLAYDTGVIDIAAGPDFTCEVYGAGSIACWGAATSLGIIPTTPSLVTGTKALLITAGDKHLCAITQPIAGGNTSVQCWGDNTYQQNGDSNSDFYVDGVNDALSISAGSYHTCVVSGALTPGGSSVQCWGAGTPVRQSGTPTPEDQGQSVVPSTMLNTSVVSVSAGGHRTCAVKAISGSNGLVESTTTCWPISLGSTVVFGDKSGPFTYGSTSSFTVSATSPSTSAIVYSSIATGVCTVDTSSGVVTIVNAGTCSITASAAADIHFAAAQATQNITINPNQTITFGAQTSQTFSLGGTFNINPRATASSGLKPVTYRSLSAGVCTVSGTTVTILTAGTCTIEASQAGNSTYSTALATQNVTIRQATQKITFAAQIPATQTYSPTGSFSINPLATTTSSASIAYSSLTTDVCTVSGTNVTIVTAGSCTIAADAAADTNYLIAVEKTKNVTIKQAAQQISFNPPATLPCCNTYQLTASTDSNLLLTFNSTTPNNCKVTLDGLLTPMRGNGRNCKIQVQQIGDTNYKSAQVTQSITIQ